jgi:3-hydroxyisobutyrate dehydrogenase
MNIGYVGLGHMGGPLARRLQPHFPLHVYDINEAAARNLTAQGAIGCDLKALAAHSEIILLCLPTSDHVRAVIFDHDGLAAAAKPGTLIVDQTTGDPAATRAMAAELAKHGLELIDAPVSGGPRSADDGSVAIMVGASPAQYARIEPVVRTITRNIFHTGAVGTGHVAKLANNILSAAQRVMTLEAVALAAKNGIAPKTAVEVMMAGSGKNYYLEHFMGSHILTGKLGTGFSLGMLHKDVRLATELGLESSVPMLFGNLVKEFCQICINELGRDTEVNAAALVMDRLAGTHLVPSDYSLT